MIYMRNLSTKSLARSAARFVGIAMAAVGCVGVFAPVGAYADIGNCYSPRPMCVYPTQPICFCDMQLRCHWGCK